MRYLSHSLAAFRCLRFKVSARANVSDDVEIEYVSCENVGGPHHKSTIEEEGQDPYCCVHREVRLQEILLLCTHDYNKPGGLA